MGVSLNSLSYPSSVKNSTTSQLSAGSTFTGILETILSQQAAQISIYSDQPFTLYVDQYVDSSTTYPVSTDIFVRNSLGSLGGYELNENITLPGNYFRIRITNNGSATTTLLNCSATFGIMATGPRSISSLGNNKNAINEINGYLVDSNTGNASNGTIRVVVASNQPTITVSPVSGSTIGASPIGTYTISGNVTSTPSGTQTVTGTVVATPTGTHTVSGSVTANPNGTYTIVPSGTQTVSGTVTSTPSGTQTVTGTVVATPTGTHTVSGSVTANPNGTYTVSGNVTSTPSGTQTVTGTVVAVPTGTYTISGNVTSTPSGTQTVAIGSIGLNSNSPIPVYSAYSDGAFGDQISTILSQEIALIFNYLIDPDLVSIFTANTGSVSLDHSRLLISTGGTSNSTSMAKSKHFLRYRPGFGGLGRFTMGVTTGISGTEQTGGLGSEEDGYFFSYRNSTMNIVRRSFGSKDLRVLTITTGSTSSGNVTITLDGTAYVVAVSNNSGNANQTATNISANFSSINWSASSQGNIVNFYSSKSEVRSGSYSVSAGTTGIVSSLVQSISGIASSESVVPQSNWIYDQADGNGILPLINWSNGNVFQIKYQWLGFGFIQFFVENPATGRFVCVHATQYANSSVYPATANPTLPLYFYANNGSTTNNISMFTSSAAGFVEGTITNRVGGNPKNHTFTGTAGTSESILGSIFSGISFKGFASRVQISLLSIFASAAGDVTFRFYKNSNLTGTSSWNSVASNSTVFYDASSTGFVGNGSLFSSFRCAQSTNQSIVASDVESGIITILPGDIITVTAQSDNGNVKVGATFNWVEYL